MGGRVISWWYTLFASGSQVEASYALCGWFYTQDDGYGDNKIKQRKQYSS